MRGIIVVSDVSVTDVTSLVSVAPSRVGQTTVLFNGMIQSKPEPRTRTGSPGLGSAGSKPVTLTSGELASVPLGLNAGSVAPSRPGSAAPGASPLTGTTIRAPPAATTSHEPFVLQLGRPVTPVSSASLERPTTCSAPSRTYAISPPPLRAGALAAPSATELRPVSSARTRWIEPPDTSTELASSHTGSLPDGPAVAFVPSMFAKKTRPLRSTANFVPSGDTLGELPSTSAAPSTACTEPPDTWYSCPPSGLHAGALASPPRVVASPPPAPRTCSEPPDTYANSPATTYTHARA